MYENKLILTAIHHRSIADSPQDLEYMISIVSFKFASKAKIVDDCIFEI